ncbi:MAG: DNA mismatch repair endonuclease MutL, partial [Chloroflexi bacterium]|nr:DNA mismatch repair endonuclease MutL [Chloroflexota bacterium]
MGIAVLSPIVASRIAAGEVIERPASVVKELVENALDAGARRIEVEVEEAGLKLIRVSDDGGGIPMGEVELAFERHATSKLREVADLTRVTTLGFRGEALPSIAAAGRVELATATASGLGLRVALEGGQVVGRTSEGRPRGTAVTVRDLFLHLPARRRFLRSLATEAGHVAQVLSRCILGFPEVAFSLRLDGRRVLQSPGSGRAEEAVAAVLGAEVAAQILLVRYQGQDGLRLAGYVSPPAVVRANRSSIYLFVTRRWVQSRSLTYA